MGLLSKVFCLPGGVLTQELAALVEQSTAEVSFPGLMGGSFSVCRIAFFLFGIPVYWYGVIIGLGFVLAVLFCCRRARRFGIREEDVLDLLIVAVPLCIIGARTYFVACKLGEGHYRNAAGSLDWESILNIRDGGIAIYGAVIAAALTLLIFCRWKKVEFLPFADLGVQGLLIGQMVGRWGNFVNVEAFGTVTDLPWRMCSPSIAQWLYVEQQISEVTYQSIQTGELGVHPTFFYESAWNAAGFALIVLLSKKLYKFDGQLFLTYVFWYGLGRFWIEGLRTDSLKAVFASELFGYSIRTSQMVALISIIAAGVLLVYGLWFRNGNHRPLYASRLKEREEKKTKENEHAGNDY